MRLERPMSRPVKQNVDAKERFSHCQRSHAEMKTCNISKSYICGPIFDAEMKICSISFFILSVEQLCINMYVSK